MDNFSAIILGVIQGFFEFLPVSSSGHLILVREFLNLDEDNRLAIDAILHLASSLAIVVYFRRELWVLIQTLMRKAGRLPVNEKDWTLLLALVSGTVPAVVLGVLFESFFDGLATMLVIGVMLFVGSLFLMFAEWRYFLKPPQGQLTVRQGFKVGLFQALALIPGFSRLGATTAGGMLLGMTRLEAARFSLLLAVPITFGLGAKKLLELITGSGVVAWEPILLGSLVCFLLGLVTIRLFLFIIKKYSLWPFVWYRIVLSLIIIYYAVFVAV